MTFSTRIARRRFLSTTLALGAALRFSPGARAASPGKSTGLCRLDAQQEEGPFYLDEHLFRSDITEGKAGIPLVLSIAVIDEHRCAPLANATIDIWQCDALGLYSGFTRPGMEPARGPGGPPFGPPPAGTDFAQRGAPPEGPPPGPPPGMPPGPPPSSKPTDRLTFLRGIQRTDSRGNVTFHTILPGCYMGRTNHIHFKVRPAGAGQGGEHVAHTGQIFFPEPLTVALMRLDPYRKHRIPRTTQAEDPVFTGQHGAAAIARIRALAGSAYEKGLRADVIAVVDPDATPPAVDRSRQG